MNVDFAEFEEFVSHSWFAERSNSYVRWYPKSLNPNFDISLLYDQPKRVDGVYIHIPFCEEICRFCPFNKVGLDEALLKTFLSALHQEIEIYRRRFDLSGLKFIYFGGGTPSVLDAGQINSVVNLLGEAGLDLSNCEVTLETHPKHLNLSYLRAVRSAGVNRISSGIQATRDSELGALGSFHSRSDLIDGLDAVSSVYENYGVDLLYRFKGQSVDDWHRTLNEVLDLKIPHISAYALVEAKAPTRADRLLEAEMALALDLSLTTRGYKHYASCASGGYDFALDGVEGVYESLHWRAPQATYIGLGPGAFGFVGAATTVNGLGIKGYIESLETETLPLASVNVADRNELQHRFFSLGVKTLSVSFKEFKATFDIEVPANFLKIASRLQSNGIVRVTGDLMELTPLGRHFVDEVSSAFFSLNQFGVVHPEEPEIRRAELLRTRMVRTAPVLRGA